MLAFDTKKYDEAKHLAEKGVNDSINERWNRLEGFNRRLLGDIACEKDTIEARFQYEKALKLVPTSDMRIQALIELSLARLELAEGNKPAALIRATSAQTHFEKIDMRNEADDATKLTLSILAD